MLIHVKDTASGNLIDSFSNKIKELGITEYVSVQEYSHSDDKSFGIDGSVEVPFVGISEPSLDFWDVLSTGLTMSSDEIEAVLMAIVPTENEGGKSCPSSGCGGCSGC